MGGDNTAVETEATVEAPAVDQSDVGSGGDDGLDLILGEVPQTDAVDSLFSSEVHSSQSDAKDKDKDADDKKDDGDDATGKSDDDTDADGTDSSDPDKSEDDDDDADVDTDDDDDDATGDANDKSPKGFVPHQALKKERLKKKEERTGRLQAEEKSLALERQVSSLNEEIQRLKSRDNDNPDGIDPRVDRFKEFKVLSKTEFESLREEDFEAAQDYLFELDEYREFQVDQKTAEKQREKDAQAKEKAEKIRGDIISGATEAMKETAPELFNEDPEVHVAKNEELVSFAEQFGMDGDSLAVLTDPKTVVFLSGDESGTPFLLGDAAASLLKMVVGTQKAISSLDPDALRAIAEKEVKGKVTRDVAAKLKDSDGVRSLGDVSSLGAESDNGAIGSERDWAKLDPKERQRLLGG